MLIYLKHLSEKNYTLAIETYTKVLKSDVNYKIACYCLGNIYSIIELQDKAILYYKKAIEIDSDYIKVYDIL